MDKLDGLVKSHEFNYRWDFLLFTELSKLMQ